LISNYIVTMRTDHIISLISRTRDKANRLILEELKRRDIRGLAPSHGDILNLLYQLQSTSMVEIAEKIGRNKATVTALVGKLKDLGYVETGRDPEDGRVTRVALTNKGWGLKQDFEEVSQVLIQRVYDGLSEQEKEVIVHGLEKIRDNL
jgi:DNA-binding MarR family transcriptional regulator